MELSEYLKSKTYPGRALVAFKPEGNDDLYVAYWIMGRSTNSRNRVFAELTEGELAGSGLQTMAADDSLVDDPHLIIYNAALDAGNILIVTNGDQTDTIYDFVSNSDDEKYGFCTACSTRTFEDDGPNFTPRISLMINKETLACAFSILKCVNPEKETAGRNYYFYDEIQEGCGRLMTTYVDDGSPLPTFEGDPVKFTADVKDENDFMNLIWESLDEDNKISLMVSKVTKGDFDTEFSNYTNFINKYNRVEG